MGKQEVRTRSGERVAVVAGLRTPFARQSTEFGQVPAVDLGKMVVSEMLARTDIDPALIEQVVFGQVVQMPEAPNIAREIVLGTGMNIHTDAYSVTRACATSFQSAVNVAESIMAGTIDIGIAGGADSSSVLPIGVSKKLASSLLALSKTKTLGQKLNVLKSLSLKDLMPVPPAVAEYSTGLSMGQTAEQMAKSHGISRQDQDALAHRSHTLAAQAWNGSVTAANSTPLTDGAAAIMLMREGRAKELGLEILGYIRSYAFSAIGVEKDMLMGPSYATPMALDRAGITLGDLTLIDMHEAFAAQTLANLKMFASDKFAQECLGRSQAIGEVDMDKFNVLGGSLAYGHPFAATGARMITQTLRELKRRGGGLALNTACAAGGLGAAMILEVE